MAQVDAAMTYLSRSRDLATEHALLDLELASRNNIANCAVQLRDPEAGLRALLPLRSDAPGTRLGVLRQANAHDTLGHLYLLADDLREARVHAQESGRLAKLAAVKRTMQRHEALLGLIDVGPARWRKGWPQLRMRWHLPSALTYRRRGLPRNVRRRARGRGSIG